MDYLPEEGGRFSSAILADVRDFLVLRCGANGPTAEVKDVSLTKAIEKVDVAYLINYAVSALDDLSGRPMGSKDAFAKTVYSIRDVIRIAARIIDPTPSWQGVPRIDIKPP